MRYPAAASVVTGEHRNCSYPMRASRADDEQGLLLTNAARRSLGRLEPFPGLLPSLFAGAGALVGPLPNNAPPTMTIDDARLLEVAGDRRSSIFFGEDACVGRAAPHLRLASIHVAPSAINFVLDYFFLDVRDKLTTPGVLI